MKWIISVIGVAIAVAAISVFLIRDRTFVNYEGAKVGQPTSVALKALKSNGWMIISGNEGEEPCPTSLWLVEARSPDFSLELRSNQSCIVEQIERHRRGLEL